MMKIIKATSKSLPDLPYETDPDMDGLRDALMASKVELHEGEWDNPEIPWENYDMVLLNGVHSYKKKGPEFLEWLDRIDALGVKAENSTELMRWNIEKSYLTGLEEQGVPIVDTSFIKSSEFNLDLVGRIARGKGWSECVVKPSVGSTSDHCYKFSYNESTKRYDCKDDIITEELVAAGKDVIIQEYMPSILNQGELSVVMLDGKYSHSTVGVPEGGDFRIGFTFRKLLPSDPSAEMINLAHQVISCLSEVPLYARVDMLFDEKKNRFALSEMEILDPYLWLFTYPPSYGLFADGMVRRITNP